MKIRYWVLGALYMGAVLAGLMLIQGRSLYDWVMFLVPPGKIQDMLVYPLQHHHPVTYQRVLVISDVLINIFVFLPIGMMIFLVFHRIFRYGMTISLILTLLVALGGSAWIEYQQRLVPHRIPSVSDVMANTFGAILGGHIWIWRRQRRAAQAISSNQHAAPRTAVEAASGSIEHKE